jgi:hypothetical protein
VYFVSLLRNHLVATRPAWLISPRFPNCCGPVLRTRVTTRKKQETFDICRPQQSGEFIVPLTETPTAARAWPYLKSELTDCDALTPLFVLQPCKSRPRFHYSHLRFCLLSRRNLTVGIR